MEDLSKIGILSQLRGEKKPLLQLLKEKQARAEARQAATDAGDFDGGGVLGTTRAERAAQQANGEPGMNEGGVGDEGPSLTEKIINFLKNKKAMPAGRKEAPQMKKAEESILPQPLSDELKANI